MTEWNLIRQEENYNGHRFWRNSQGQIAVTDWSLRVMGRPETTQDGLLLLDTTRPVIAVDCGIPFVPLVTPDGRKYHTPSSEGDVKLCVSLGMRSEIPEPQPQRRRW